MNHQDKKYLSYFFAFLCLALIVTLGAIIAIDDTSEYQPLDINTEISDRVTNVGGRAARSIQYIDFEQGQKISIMKGTMDFEDDSIDLMSFIGASDFVEKRAGSDKIYVTRSAVSKKAKTYVFLLGGN
jgi:hypothetical protein